jgi:hypothetical protein
MRLGRLLLIGRVEERLSPAGLAAHLGVAHCKLLLLLLLLSLAGELLVAEELCDLPKRISSHT